MTPEERYDAILYLRKELKQLYKSLATLNKRTTAAALKGDVDTLHKLSTEEDLLQEQIDENFEWIGIHLYGLMESGHAQFTFNYRLE